MLKSTVSKMLKSIMVVMGKYKWKFSFSILISPGNLPIQCNLFPKKYQTSPARNIIAPINMIYFAIDCIV